MYSGLDGIELGIQQCGTKGLGVRLDCVDRGQREACREADGIVAIRSAHVDDLGRIERNGIFNERHYLLFICAEKLWRTVYGQSPIAELHALEWAIQYGSSSLGRCEQRQAVQLAISSEIFVPTAGA